MENKSTNLSKIKRDRLVAMIDEIKNDTSDPGRVIALNEIKNELLDMKYGLKWEKHEEEVDRQVLTQIPVFKEDKEREIVKNDEKFNFLLEGDNLHSLMLLEKTHKNAISVLYLDPPYNRGKNDFKYGDKVVDTEDDFRHSKWLSFMERRLKIAYELLAEDGCIFVSIDDNEQANLKLLMDSIFGEQNMIANIIWQSKSGGAHDVSFVAVETEYIFLYAKHKGSLRFNKVKAEAEQDSRYKYSDKHVSKRGKYLLNKLDRTSLGYLESLDFPITIDGLTGIPGCTTVENGKKIWRWRWGKEKVEWGIENDFLVAKKKNGIVSIYSKQYQYVDNDGLPKERETSFRNLITDIKTTTSDSEIKNLFGKKIFSYPKPTLLIERLISLHPNKNATILDFFAGSGTTGHAVLELNKEDGGNRKFILCTNNEVGEAKEKEFKKLHGDKNDHPDKWAAWEDEYGIARSVTYKRLEKVINGYTTPKGKEVEGIPANLKYYKTEYIPREKDDDDYDAHEEINNYIAELIQLEFGIDIHDPSIGLVLSDEYMESDHFNIREIDDEKLNQIEDIYIAEGLILPDGLEETINKRGIKIHWVPQYYKF